jgi:tight adherence protein C
VDVVIVAASAAVVGSILLIGQLVFGAKTSSVDLGQVGGASDDLRARQLRQSASDRVAKPGLERLGAALRAWTPAGRVARLERRIASAGSPVGWTVERILAGKVMLAVVVALLVLVIVDLSLGGIVLVVLGAAMGFFTPDALLDRRIRGRNQAVRRELADVIDQVSMMVQAGLGVDAALARAAVSNDGPLADELARVGQDVRVGVDRSVALSNMAERVEVPELRTVVAALVQAERLGSPVSQTLQIQSQELRLKRRQHAEEQAMKLPVKLLFPMVFCILPVLLTIILAPAVISIFDTFG